MTGSSTPKVIVFTTTTCSYCRAVKDHLRKHKVTFREIDIGRDERAAKEMVRITGQQGVPVILINNRPVVGFNRPEIDRLLGIR